MQIVTGHQLRTLRRERNIPLRTLSVLSSVNINRLCGFELGATLWPSDLDNVELVMSRIEALRLHFVPAKLDFSDVAALKAALDAFDRGDFALAARARAPEPEPNPSVITS